MMRCLLGAVARVALVDETSKNVSLIEILDNIETTTLPIFIPNMAAVFLLERTAADPVDVNLTIGIEVDGVLKHTAPVSVTFAEKLRARLIARIGGYAVMEPGLVAVTLSLADQVLSKSEIPVVLVDIDAAPAAQVSE